VAQAARKKVGERYPAELAALQATVKLEDILQTAEQVLAPVPARLREETIRGLSRIDLTRAHRVELLLAYKLGFERVRS
jgi:hypothetical protein